LTPAENVAADWIFTTPLLLLDLVLVSGLDLGTTLWCVLSSIATACSPLGARE
jgi:bacteriorhodopsin